METVWIAIGVWCEDTWVIGVYLTEDSADKAAEHWRKDKNRLCNGSWAEEWPVQR